MAQVFLKRVCLGAGAYCAWSGLGAVLSHAQHEALVDMEGTKLAKEISELKDTLEREGKEARQLIEGLHEEMECYETMNKGIHELWKERSRRWRDVKEFDDMIGLVPWVFWQWKRLEKWYGVLKQRLEHHEDFKRYEYTCMHLNDMKMASILDAYDADAKAPRAAQTITMTKQAANNEPFLALLEASVRNIPEPFNPVPSLVRQKQALSSLIIGLPASPTFQPLYEEISSVLRRYPVNELTIDQLSEKLDTTESVLRYAMGENQAGTSADLQKAIELTAAMKAEVTDYRILLQAHRVYEAYMTTLLLSTLPPQTNGS